MLMAGVFLTNSHSRWEAVRVEYDVWGHATLCKRHVLCWPQHAVNIYKHAHTNTHKHNARACVSTFSNELFLYCLLLCNSHIISSLKREIETFYLKEIPYLSLS